MSYVVLSVEVARDAVDWVRMIVGASALADAHVAVEPIADEQPYAYTVRVAIAEAAYREAAAAELDRDLQSLRKAGMVGDLFVETADAPPASPRATQQRIGERFVVVSGAADATLAADDLVLRVPPSAAFGTGVHPTTRACLRLLERHVVAGMNALDLGSGTGILSVALARLGARVLALDNDPVAVDATRATVALNGLDAEVTVAAGSLHAGATLGHWMGGSDAVADSPVADNQRFDLLVANVFARIHAALVDDYRRAVRPGGLLVVAGFTLDYADDLTAQLGEAAFSLADRHDEGEWVALAFRSVGPGDD